MHVSQSHVFRFAKWSGDRNPLHVDEVAGANSVFGRCVVHGVLSSIEALRHVHQTEPISNLAAIEIDFRDVVFPCQEIYIERTGDQVIIATAGEGHRRELVRVGFESSLEASTIASSVEWIETALDGGTHNGPSDVPLDWNARRFVAGETWVGVHRFDEEMEGHAAACSPLQEKSLALCSYLVGMKAPGLSSLFTRLQIDFTDISRTQNPHEITYQLKFVDYDVDFRLLETQLQIATVAGDLIAEAKLTSYVRFPQRVTTPRIYRDAFGGFIGASNAQVFLVLGASRGLGAEIASALGASGAQVYLSCRTRSPEIDTLVEQIRALGGHADILVGDAGDPQWCEEACQTILRQEQRLDGIILNACSPPIPTAISAANAEQSAKYISANVALFKTPLAAFLPTLEKHSGIVVGISSSFVERSPAGFSDYVSVKVALEATLRAVVGETENVRALVARPPKLQTRWNDTPTGAIGTISPSSVAVRLVAAINRKSSDARFELIDEFAELEQSETSEAAVDATQLDVVLVSSFTLDPIVDMFKPWSRHAGIDIRPHLAPYAQILQQCLLSSSEMCRSAGGSVVLLRVSDWLRERSTVAESHEQQMSWLRATADEYISALRSQRQSAAGPTLLLICPSIANAALSSEEISLLEDLIRDRLKNAPGLTVRTTVDFHRACAVPDHAFHDELRDEIAHIPYQDAYYQFLATLIVRTFYRLNSPPKKVVVLDCDNTLWKGVVGELGSHGILFERQHRHLHNRLSELIDAGILVCLCSKNEEHDVWRVFDERTDLTIGRGHIVASTINWLPKSQNIRQLADSLQLGLDSFIFLDDNPVECAEVRAGCPQVLTLQWPEDADQAVALLDHLWELDVLSTTAEDQKRVQRYKEEADRGKLRESSQDFQAFLDSLQLNIDIRPLDEADIARASQLTMRTNQFNLTTIRRTENEIANLASDANYLCRTIRVDDRFGEYGLVGLFIARITEQELDVDTFLLSCRVLGRGVEHRMVREIGQLAKSLDRQTVHWQYIPTDRNTPARLFLEKVGHAAIQPHEGGAVDLHTDVAALLECRVDADENATSEKPIDTNELSTQSGQTPAGRPNPRGREQQIVDVALHRSSYFPADAESRLGASPGSSPADSTHRSGANPNFLTTPSHSSDNVSLDAVRQSVIAIFAEALKISADEVQRIDRLDAMGCDSLRIVTITVRLTKEYPWLPKTLLFEHPRVSDIVDAIGELAAGEPHHSALGTLRASVGRDLTINTDVAIVGIGVHCAAGHSVQDLWKLLSSGGLAIRPVPPQRDSFFGTLNDDRSHFAGLIDDAADFDPEFFGISPREAEFMDPQLRILLQSAWHALEDAGSLGEQFEPQTGVFIGAMYMGYAGFANAYATQSGSLYRCWESFSLANRISQTLGFSGPSLSIDTACSSSATALHFARESLAKGDCGAALVGGVNLIVDPNRLVQLGRLGILSPSGRCVPFGDQADGTVMGEGSVTVLLRPLADAQRRGDRIYAVIKGTGISSGAGSVGFTAPNPAAQSIATRQAIAAAEIDPRTVTYIETHGTGTELGDPIEVRGLEMAYCDRATWQPNLNLHFDCAIGSIKPNVGHLEAGAGLMGVVKAALQLHHKCRVPSITSTNPNPQLPLERLPFKIQRALQSWTQPNATLNGAEITIPRRAGVNSFGVGGSNVHIILEETPEVGVSEKPARDPVLRDRTAHLLALSTPSHTSLQLQIDAWMDQFADSADDRADLCYSVNTGREHYANRAAVLVSDDPDTGESTPTLIRSTGPQESAVMSSKTAFLYSGQGSQYPQMGIELYQASPVFRQAMDECLQILQRDHGIDLDGVWRLGDISDPQHSIHHTGFTQPALFSIQYSLAQLWHSWGVKADVSCGHSVGEIAAFCVNGGCSLEDGIHLAAARGRLMQALPQGGAMCSAAISLSEAEDWVRDVAPEVAIAAINGPNQIVFSGAQQDIDALSETLQSSFVKVTRLSVSHAFHSKLMEPMLEEFGTVLASLDLHVPTSTIVSSVTGEKVGSDMAVPKYWLDQARNPVRFLDAVRTLDRNMTTHYIEIGPHPVMLGMGRACLPESNATWLPSMRRGRSDWENILNSLGHLYVDGFNIDFRGLDRGHSRKRVSALGYQFDRRRIWLDDATESRATWMAASGNSTSTLETLHSGGSNYEIEWIEQCLDSSSRNPTVANQSQCQWIIVSENDTLNASIVERLQGRTITAIAMSPAEFIAQSWGSRTPSWNNCSRIVFLFDSLPDSTDAAETSQRAIQRTAVAVSLVNAFHSIAELPQRSGWIVTHQTAMGAGDEHGFGAVSSPLWGLGRTAALEISTSWGGLIDVSDWSQSLDACIDELLSPSDETQVCLRDSQRLVPRMQPVTDDNVARRPRPSELIDAGSSRRAEPSVGNRFDGGTVLITGGLGAIGIAIASWLADQGAGHLILVSRSGTAPPAAAAAIEAMRQRGCNVITLAEDVATQEGVRRCLDAVGDERLLGIIHAAGVDSVQPLRDVATADVESVLAAKVAGGWLLHDATRDLDLDFFVCISSVSSVWGSSARGLYSAANAFLDSLIQLRRLNGQPGLAMNYGPWTGGGMADEQSLSELAKIGNRGVSPQEAIEAIRLGLDDGAVQRVFANVDWQKFRPIIESRGRQPIFERLGAMHPSASQSTESKPKTGMLDDALWLAVLSREPADHREAKLRELLTQEIGKLLKLPERHLPSKEQALFSLGMDSLSSIELKQSVEKKLGGRVQVILRSDATVGKLCEQWMVDLEPYFNTGDIDQLPSQEENPQSNATQRSCVPSNHSEVAMYCDADEPKVIEFCSRAWPNRPRELIEKRWRWMFVDSATRLGEAPRVWLVRDNDAVVAHHGAQFVRLQVDGNEVNTAWFVETMVLPEYRDRGFGAEMLLESRNDMPLNLSLGQTAQMRSINLRAGWETVAPLETYLLMLNPTHVLRGKIPGALVPVASSWSQIQRMTKGLLANSLLPDTRAVEIDHYESRHDQLWRDIAHDYPCAVVRDAAYMEWKYVEQPGQAYTRLDVLAGEELIGSLVLKIFERDSVYQYRRLQIVEIVSSTSPVHLASVLQAAIDHGSQHGVDAIFMHVINDSLENALRKAGFIRRQPTRHLLVSRCPEMSEFPILDRRQWLITGGDSDIDRLL